MAIPVVLKSDLRNPTSTHNLHAALVTDMIHRSPALERRHNLALVSKLVHASISERLTLRHLARSLREFLERVTIVEARWWLAPPGWIARGKSTGAEGHGRESRQCPSAVSGLLVGDADVPVH